MTTTTASSSASSASLADNLSDPTRPTFLLGDVPPREGTPPGKCLSICQKFMTRSRTLACDGFIVYDIQDEPGRATSGIERPFPFRQLMDSSEYAALLSRSSGKPCVVYKCIADAKFEEWIDRASTEHGHSAINLVGRPSASQSYEGPTMAEAMQIASTKEQRTKFGCVCIAERHTMEAAAARGKKYPTEHLNMLKKQKAGARWFVSQAVYDAEPTIRLLTDYAAECRKAGLAPRKVLLTFCPVSRPKTMQFVKWLGVRVPDETETNILQSDKPVDSSIDVLCTLLRTILQETSGIGVPLGISCESVSIYKAEIDGVHELFRRLQSILLDARGSPWKVHWVEILGPPGVVVAGSSAVDGASNTVKDGDHNSKESLSLFKAALAGAVVGTMILTQGIFMGMMLANIKRPPRR